MAALEDVRSCSFSGSFKIKEAIENSLYLTPHFLEHFDFNDVFDHEIMRLRMYLNAVTLGFRFEKVDMSGNLD